MPNLASLYSAVGGPAYPRFTLALCTLVFALAGYLFWNYAAQEFARSKMATSGTHVSGSATTFGDGSPAITGDGNTVTTGQQPSETEKDKKK